LCNPPVNSKIFDFNGSNNFTSTTVFCLKLFADFSCSLLCGFNSCTLFWFYPYTACSQLLSARTLYRCAKVTVFPAIRRPRCVYSTAAAIAAAKAAVVDAPVTRRSVFYHCTLLMEKRMFNDQGVQSYCHLGVVGLLALELLR